MPRSFFSKKFSVLFQEVRFAFYVLLPLLFIGALSGCGSASPQASIPAPVSQLIAISSPIGGMVTVTGAPGAVEGGATVDIINATQFALSQNRFPWLIKSAFAQAVIDIEIVAGPEGDFSAEISASVSDIIQVTQTVNGITSQPVSFQVEPTPSSNNSSFPFNEMQGQEEPVN